MSTAPEPTNEAFTAACDAYRHTAQRQIAGSDLSWQACLWRALVAASAVEQRSGVAA